MSRLNELLNIFNTVMSFGRSGEKAETLQDKSQVKNQQFTINKYVQQWNQARTVSEKQNLARNMSSYYNSLSFDNQAALKPFLTMSPLDPALQKKEQYRSVMPPPVVDADFTVNPLAYAEQAFALEDWKRGEKEFMLGIEDDKRNLIGLPGGFFGQRNELGNIDILTEETLELKEFAKQNNTTVGTLLANNLKHFSKDTKEILVNGKVFKVQPFVDLRTKTTGTQQQFQRTLQPGKVNKKLQEFLGAFASDDVENPTFKIYNSFLDIGGEEGITQANNYLQTQFPEFTFIFRKGPVSKGYFTRAWERGLFDGIASDFQEKHFVIAIPGKPITLPGKPTTLKDEIFYFNDKTNSLYSSDGVRVTDPINLMRMKGVNPDEFFDTAR